jgi:hypothetical protein
LIRVEAFDLVLGIDHLRLQTGLQVRIGRHIGHFGDRFRELLLGVIDVFELMQEEIFHRFDVFGEDAHFLAPLLNELTQRSSKPWRFPEKTANSVFDHNRPCQLFYEPGLAACWGLCRTTPWRDFRDR